MSLTEALEEKNSDPKKAERIKQEVNRLKNYDRLMEAESK